MKQSKKGFTLVELMIVIVIIGILAAIIIPSVSSAINKAKIAEGVSNAKNMTTLVNMKFIDYKDAVDVQDVILNNGYSLDSGVEGYGYWYSMSNRTIKFVKNSEVLDGSVQFGSIPNTYADGEYKGDTLEELKLGYLFIDMGTSKLAKALQTIRNLANTSLDDFSSAKALFANGEYSSLKDHIEQFDPKNCLYINNQRMVTGAPATNGTIIISKVVYANKTVVMPMVMQIENNGEIKNATVEIAMDNNASFYIPSMVKIVSANSLTMLHYDTHIDADFSSTIFMAGSLPKVFNQNINTVTSIGNADSLMAVCNFEKKDDNSNLRYMYIDGNSYKEIKAGAGNVPTGKTYCEYYVPSISVSNLAKVTGKQSEIVSMNATIGNYGNIAQYYSFECVLNEDNETKLVQLAPVGYLTNITYSTNSKLEFKEFQGTKINFTIDCLKDVNLINLSNIKIIVDFEIKSSDGKAIEAGAGVVMDATNSTTNGTITFTGGVGQVFNTYIGVVDAYNNVNIVVNSITVKCDKVEILKKVYKTN